MISATKQIHAEYPTLYALTNKHYQVKDIITLLYKAIHKKGSAESKQWLKEMDVQLEALHQEMKKGFLHRIHHHWREMLVNFLEATTKFEQLYYANCPFAGIMPSPVLKRLKRMNNKTKSILYQLELNIEKKNMKTDKSHLFSE